MDVQKRFVKFDDRSMLRETISLVERKLTELTLLS